MPSRRSFLLTPAVVAVSVAQDRRSVILERAQTLSAFAGQQIPEASPQVLEQADKIARGTVFFYGRTPVEVGLKDIDWAGGHIHHQEWPAQLNRFFHLAPLAAAYRVTGEERFAQAARSYIEDWIRGDPYATATVPRPGDNMLNMSIRLGTGVQSGWGWTLPAFLRSPAFDEAFLDRMFASISQQADYLSRHLTTTGNFRISELDTLVFTALRLPFLPNAHQLLEAGIMGMRNALATQFLADGVHVERTPGYADWMARVATNFLHLKQLFPEVDAHVDPDRLVRALDYSAQSVLFGVNDASAPPRDPSDQSRLQTRAETIQRLGLKAPSAPPLEQVFPNAGQVFLRSAWKPGADYLAFDASTWGGGHGHLSRLSFVFRSGGRALVTDPGILNYEMSDPLASYGKSTPAHSTLNVGGWNQSGADAQLLRTEFTPGIALIHAKYEGGYWEGRYEWSFRNGRGRGVWGAHERVLLWAKGQYVLVLDTMATDAGEEVRNAWQMGPMERCSHDSAGLEWWSENQDTNLSLRLLAPPEKTVMQCYEGSKEPLRGWIGVHGNDAVPAPQVEFRYPAGRSGSVVSAVLLVPFSKDRPRYAVSGDADLSRGSIHHLQLELPDGSTDHIAWTSGLELPVDDARPFITDATLVWCRNKRGGAPSRAFLLDGSYLKQGNAVLRDGLARKGQWLEW